MESGFWKMILFIALLASCVFLGVELASSGLERVVGPGPEGGWSAWGGDPYGGIAADGQGQRPTDRRTDSSAPLPEQAAAGQEQAEPGASPTPQSGPEANPASAQLIDPVQGYPEQRRSLVNAVSFWIGDVLRYIAQGLIRFIADVFSAIVH